MKILVINSGSSSIKFQVLDMNTEKPLASGLVERIGENEGSISLKSGDTEHEVNEPVPNHDTGLRRACDLLADPDKGAGIGRADIKAVGHRVVHGGEFFHKPVLITPEVMDGIREVEPLAPLHNPAHLAGMEVAMELFPSIPQAAVFDTAFHQTIPPHGYMYALPWDLYEKHKVRRYGFHGTSHKYVAEECARLMGRDIEDTNLITIHLGNGCSATAVKNGRSIDTSMGLTPLEGLVMGTRSGSLDPAVHGYLHRTLGLGIEEIDTLLNKESGLKGLCGLNDMRDIHARIEDGDTRAKVALDVQTYRIKKYIGSYMAVSGRVDGIVFTAGIGENDPVVREKSLEGLDRFGVLFNPEANRQRSREARCISLPESPVQVWVIPTNEELAIARETRSLVEG